MIPTAAHIAADCQCVSMGHTTPQNCPFLWSDLDTHLIHGSLGPVSQPPNSTSTGSAVFAGTTNVTNRQTDRQMHRQTMLLHM